ncbi:MAG TPA: metalloregulator ArsR/SmtB family transcription factor [Bacteroidota bacterium]|nr:metalloregulator ArsR/SmtB family transcription factor [Bacteroidota bacterium]
MRRDVFQAIADPNRRAILNLLAGQRLTLNGLAEHFDISRPAVSRHIKILTECGLIATTQRGRERHCEAKVERLKEVSDWVDRHRQLWEDRLDALDAYLKTVQQTKRRRRSSKTRRAR